MRKIESEFCKCSHFLNTILMNSVKRGSFPHCKLCTLAHSMTFQFTVKTHVKAVCNFLDVLAFTNEASYGLANCRRISVIELVRVLVKHGIPAVHYT